MGNNHKKQFVQSVRPSTFMVAGAGYFSGTSGTGSILPTNTYLGMPGNALTWSAGPQVAQVGYSFIGSPNQAGAGTGAANQPGFYVVQLDQSYAGLISAFAQVHGRPDYTVVISGSVSGSTTNSTGSIFCSLLSGTTIAPNSAVVLNLYATGSTVPTQYVNSGSTNPLFLTFQFLLQNSSRQR